MKALRGRFSGLCQPTYILDIPGGFGKVPIGPSYVNLDKDKYAIEDYCEHIHTYPLNENS
jgi:lysine 2,3-aminomutase